MNLVQIWVVSEEERAEVRHAAYKLENREKKVLGLRLVGGEVVVVAAFVREERVEVPSEYKETNISRSCRLSNNDNPPPPPEEPEPLRRGG